MKSQHISPIRCQKKGVKFFCVIGLIIHRKDEEKLQKEKPNAEFRVPHQVPIFSKFDCRQGGTLTRTTRQNLPLWLKFE